MVAAEQVDPQRILVFGAGALGSVFGGFLSRRHDVTLLGRPWHLDVVRHRGLRVRGIWGSHTFKRLSLCTEFRELIEGQAAFDIILLTTSSADTASAARLMRPLVGSETVVVSLQNGLGNVEALRRYIPAEKILAGRVIFGVEIEPGVVTVTVCADDVCIGETGGARGIRRARAIAALFAEAGIPARAVRDVERYLWAKAIYNCALNGLATLLEVPYGRLLESEETRGLVRRIVEEIYAVAARGGIRLRPPTAEGYRRILFRRLIPQTAAHHPSMLQMIRMGKRTEIDALNGAIGRLGRQHGVPTPVNDLIADLIRATERLRTTPRR